LAAATKVEIAARKVDEAVADLLGKATRFEGTSGTTWATRDLLAAAREYARAVNRLTRVRG
jgi:hypothetical protein